MKKLAILILLFITSPLGAAKHTIQVLQGAWWSDLNNPTADFAIEGNQVWLDTDSQYHLCEIRDGVLIFDLGEGRGFVRNKIISIKGDRLVLEHIQSKKRTTYKRAKP